MATPTCDVIENLDENSVGLHDGEAEKIELKPKIDDLITVQREVTEFRCAKCDIFFGTEEERHNHTIEHLKYSRTCFPCNKVFSTSRNLELHLESRKHSAKPKYQCNLCHKKFRILYSLTKHKLFHSPSRFFKCTKCWKRFFSEKDLKIHDLEHSAPDKYRCSICDKEYQTKTGLVKHTCKYVCYNCKQQFSTQEALKSHQEVHKASGKWFKCDVCKTRFLYKCSLKNHIHFRHRRRYDDEKISCDVCFKLFTKRYMMIHYKKAHVDLVCGECNEKCHSPRDLLRHKRIYHKKIAKCDVCGKVLQSPGGLKQHMKMHGEFQDQQSPSLEPKMAEDCVEEDEDIVCPECYDPFPTVEALRDHYQVHKLHRKIYQTSPGLLGYFDFSAGLDLKSLAKETLII